ncbi:hypothetical protein JKF63_07402 [Porcisia hertigi]|uniref:Vacuolar protein sorting-associated protein VTA1 n=1 Tax=Porcisia hertigi TaxID=2761500 RepID=A0A836YGM8_9TRYP|nr:hypothetical protein JKF63_07402 [Porcisia hertigi]
MMSSDKLLAKVPQSWMPLVRPFLQRSHEFEDREPLVAYFLCTHVAFVCMRLRKKDDKEGTAFLMTLLDALEASKAKLGEQLKGVDGRTVLTKFALMIFTCADDAERTGSATMAIVRLFYTASVLFEATAQFTEDGTMDTIAAQKSKYAKYIAARMKKALETKEPYVSPNKMEGVEDEAVHGSCANAAGQAPGFTAAPANHFISSSTPPPSAAQYNASPPSSAPPPATAKLDAQQQPPPPPLPPPSTMNSYAPPQPHQLPPPQQQHPRAPTSHSSVGGTGFKPSVDQMIDAQKLASQAVSALQFYDSDTAKQRLIAALRLLNGAQ